MKDKSPFKHPDGIIYFVKLDMPNSPIKIGFTKTSIRTRLLNLQQISPYRLLWLGSFNGSYLDERRAHRLLAADLMRTEWFYPTADVLDFIASKAPGFTPLFVEQIPYTKPIKGKSRLDVELNPENGIITSRRSALTNAAKQFYSRADTA